MWGPGDVEDFVFVSLEGVQTFVGVSDIVQDDSLVGTACKENMVNGWTVAYCEDFALVCLDLGCWLVS